MDTNFTAGWFSQSFLGGLYLKFNGGQISPIGYFGSNCKFLKGKAYNGGIYVS